MQTPKAINRPAPQCLSISTGNGKIRKICTCTYCKGLINENEGIPFFIIPPKIRVGKNRQGIHHNCLIDATKKFGIIIEGEITLDIVLWVLREEFNSIDAENDIGFARSHWLMNASEMIFGNSTALICKRTGW